MLSFRRFLRALPVMLALAGGSFTQTVQASASDGLPTCDGALCGPAESLASGFPALDAGVKMAPQVFGPSGACPEGVRYGSVDLGVGSAGWGGSCRVWTNPRVVATMTEAAQCSLGLHEAGHAVYGLEHTATGLMSPNGEVQGVCRTLFPEPPPEVEFVFVTETSAEYEARRRHECRKRPARCRRLSPKLAARALGHPVKKRRPDRGR